MNEDSQPPVWGQPGPSLQDRPQSPKQGQPDAGGQHDGLVENLAHAEYLQTHGVSKSMLDYVHKSPALLQWSQAAPVDAEAVKAVDLGLAFETLLLEPDRWRTQYAVAPDVDRRTTAGKAQWQEFLAESHGHTVIEAGDAHRVRLMVESVRAHPLARSLLESEHLVQPSYFWIDPVTDARCRCRPDILLRDSPMIVDVKTSSDMARLRRSAGEFRYHVQDAFYSDGLTEHYGVQPHFLFLVVFTTHSAGRFPVHVMEFDIDAKHQGVNEYRSDLERYLECVDSGDWTHIEPLHLPAWARNETDL